MSDQVRNARPMSLWIVIFAAVGGVVLVQLYRTFVQLAAFRAFAVVFVSLTAEALPYLALGALFQAVVDERFRSWAGSRIGLHAHAVLAPVVNPVMILSTLAAFRGRMGMAGARFLLLALCAVPLVVVGTRLYGRRGVEDNKPPARPAARGGAAMLALAQKTSDHFLALARPFIVAALMVALIQVATPPDWAMALRARPLAAIGAAIALAFLLSVGPESDAFIARSLPGFIPPAAIVAYLVASPWLRLSSRTSALLLAVAALLAAAAATALHAVWTGGWW